MTAINNNQLATLIERIEKLEDAKEIAALRAMIERETPGQA